jgi:NAD(P)H-dependent nitrite reductase small subunit
MQEQNGWQRIAALADLADDRAFAAKLGNRRIALYRLNGKVHALDDVCTHALALLSQGFIEDGAVECPLHGARFDIATGRCLSPPATVDLHTYEVRIEGGEVFVREP